MTKKKASEKLKPKRQSPEAPPTPKPPTAKSKGKDLASNSYIAYQEELDVMQTDRARNIDDLSLYDELLGGVLGAVKNDLSSGMTSEQILSKYAAIAAARTVTIASTDSDSGRALAAAKDILDRTMGRAVERKQIQHKLENVDPGQLDALLLSELSAIEIESNTQGDADEHS